MVTRFDEVFKCPHCQAPQVISTFSGPEPILGALWSDGYVKMSYVPGQRDLTICLSCDEVYWADQAERVGRVMPRDTRNRVQKLLRKEVVPEGWVSYEEAEHLPNPMFVTYHHYSTLVHKEPWRHDNEEYDLRLQWYWFHNTDYFRYEKIPKHVLPEEQLLNLRRLLELRQPEGEIESFIALDMHRMLGQFEEATALLEKVDWKEMPFYALCQRSFIEMKDRNVHNLTQMFAAFDKPQS